MADEPIFDASYTAVEAKPPPPDPIRIGTLEVPPPPEEVLPAPLPLLLVALAAGSIIDKPPRPKKEPMHKREEANKKVVKVSDCYDVIDKVVTNRAMALAVLKILPALWHIQSPHFPKWLDLAHGFAELESEPTEGLRNDLKDAVFDKALGQTNTRLRGQWTREQLEVELQIREGKLHKGELLTG